MNITILVLLYPKTLNDGAITLYNIENYVTNSVKKTEVESSRTHFEVLGLGLEDQVLGLEASSLRKLAVPRLKDSTIF